MDASDIHHGSPFTTAENPRVARDILIVSHSRGGSPTTLAITVSQSRYHRALRGLGGGVVHLLYMCAFTPFPGESVFTCFAGIRAPVKVLSVGPLGSGVLILLSL